jgi:hypothetical protein
MPYLLTTALKLRLFVCSGREGKEGGGRRSAGRVEEGEAKKGGAKFLLASITITGIDPPYGIPLKTKVTLYGTGFMNVNTLTVISFFGSHFDIFTIKPAGNIIFAIFLKKI